MEKKDKKVFVKRVFMTIFGVVLSALSVGLFKLAAFGVDPFQSLMCGLDAMIPIQFGTLYVIVNVVLLLFSLICEKSYIGLGTFINLFLTGYIVDFSANTLRGIFENPNLVIRIASIVIAIIIMCFASSLYFTANMGVSTYDAIALILSGKYKLMQFKYMRIVCDILCVILGCVLFVIAGNSFVEIPTKVAGIGTIITAFFMGPLIDFFNRKVARPMLGIKDGEENE